MRYIYIFTFDIDIDIDIDSGITNLIHDRCSCTRILFTLSSVGRFAIAAPSVHAWLNVSTQA